MGTALPVAAALTCDTEAQQLLSACSSAAFRLQGSRRAQLPRLLPAAAGGSLHNSTGTDPVDRTPLAWAPPPYGRTPQTHHPNLLIAQQNSRFRFVVWENEVRPACGPVLVVQLGTADLQLLWAGAHCRRASAARGAPRPRHWRHSQRTPRQSRMPAASVWDKHRAPLPPSRVGRLPTRGCP